MPRDELANTASRRADSPDRLILVYDGDSGLGPMLIDATKKAVGKEHCPLCEITHGPLGKRKAWRRCEARLGVIVDELHRDRIPDAWGVSGAELPCILGRVRAEPPFVLLTRADIATCSGNVGALEARLRRVLAAQRGVR